MKLNIKRVRENAKLPVRQTPGASGLDLHAAESCTIRAGERRKVPTGIAVQPGEEMNEWGYFDIPYECQVRPRSGMSAKGIDASLGTVDADYVGEILVTLANNSGADVKINEGDRIAQLVVTPLPKVEIVEVTELRETKRGTAGYGSTGK